MSSRVLAGALAKRYANAFLSLVADENGLEKAGQDLRTVQEVFSSHAQLFHTLCNSTIPLAERKAVLTQVLEKLSVAVSTRNFLLLLLQKQRMVIFPEINRRFAQLADERAGILRAHIIVASSLPAGAEEKIAAELTRLTEKKVLIEIEEKPEVIGGLIAKIGHTVIDASLRTHLDKLKKQMLSQQL